MKQKLVEQATITELNAEATQSYHQAVILKILAQNPGGLLAETIRQKEPQQCGYTFLTQPILKRLQQRGFIESYGAEPKHWRLK